jgi:mycothiol synthase
VLQFGDDSNCKIYYLPVMAAVFRNLLVIRRPGPAERRVVLEMAVSDLCHEWRRALIATPPVDDRQRCVELLGAWRGDRLVGAVWGEIQPGSSGLVHLPARLPNEPYETGAALLAEWERGLCAQGVRFYQLQLDEITVSDAAVLTAVGIRHVGYLLFLASDLRHAAPPPPELDFEPYRESQRDRLAALIARTYQNSLDLPALDAVRTPHEVLEGYRKCGAFRPQGWRFVREAGEDIGCLLLTEHAARQWELIYMGLVPASRGRGAGCAVTAYAQYLVRELGGTNLLLAVDAANTPAVVAYRRTGFTPWRRSSIFLKVLQAAGVRGDSEL